MLRKIFTPVIFFLSVFFLIPNFSFGQTPTPIMNCGFADSPGVDMCCEGILIEKQNFEDIKEGLPLPAETVVNILGELYFKVDPLKKIGADQLIQKCYLGDPVESGGKCMCKQTQITTPPASLEKICTKYTNGNERAFCINCAKGGGFSTAIGCVPLNVGNFITDYMLGRLIGLAGLVSLFCIIYSAFMIQTSGGNPERIKKAQEMMTSCVMGLILIIFSVFILRVIGVDILKIPFLTTQ